MRVYPFSDTKYLCISSLFIGLSSLALYALNQKMMALILGFLCFSSINHWRNYLENGWRQRLDISYVGFCLLYIMYRFFQETEFMFFMGMSLLFTIGLLCLYTYICEHLWVVVHSTIHLYVSFFIPFLYML